MSTFPLLPLLKLCSSAVDDVVHFTKRIITITQYQALNNSRLKQEETLMFCSPFRRRRRREEEVEERQLTREEAWHLYLAKLEEEANYFSVSEREEEPDICTCHTCIVRYYYCRDNSGFTNWNCGNREYYYSNSRTVNCYTPHGDQIS